MSKDGSSSGGVGFLGLLSVAFIVLKLCNVINWPWWLVLSPLWGSVAMFLVVLVIIIIVSRFKRRRRK